MRKFENSGMRKREIILFFVLIISGIQLYSQNEIKNLEVKISSAKEDTNKVNLLFQLSEICAEEDILKYSRQSLKLSEKLKFKKGIANSYINIGFYYANYSSNMLEALQYYQKSLALNEELGNQQRMAELYSNIGYLMEKQGEFHKSLEFYQKSYRTACKIKDSATIGVSSGNIAQAYTQLGMADSTLYYIHISYAINKKINNIEGLSTANNNLGMYYKRKKQYDSALFYLNQDKNILEKLNDKRGLTFNLLNTAGIYKELNRIDEAQKLALMGYNLANKLRIIESIQNASQILSIIYKLKGDYKNAFDMLLLNKLMSDSVLNAGIHKKIIESQLKFEFEKQTEREKAQQEKKDAVLFEKNEKQKLIISITLVALCIALLLAAFAYKNYLQKRKANDEISLQKNVIEEKQKEILDSIHYAKRIQNALLPSEKYIDRNLNKLNDGSTGSPQV